MKTILFSSQDDEGVVCLYRNNTSQWTPTWIFVGRQQSHIGSVLSLSFIKEHGSEKERLLSLGQDSCIVQSQYTCLKRTILVRTSMLHYRWSTTWMLRETETCLLLIENTPIPKRRPSRFPIIHQWLRRASLWLQITRLVWPLIFDNLAIRSKK